MPAEASPKKAAPSIPDLDRIGKYKIVAKIGQGAMGYVYKARDTVLDRHVAIKTMSAMVTHDPEITQRFLREAQSAARLNHPNVVTLHDFGEDQGQHYMAMELLDGQDLKDHIKNGTLGTLEDKLQLMGQICDGLAYAHTQQVVHRDLKPANIHVATDGLVKIMDFGLARLGQSDMTRAGTVLGSPNYMSPEQVRGQRADARSDVFSLGAVFYEVLSKRRAFDGESMPSIMYQVTDVDPVPLLDLLPDLPFAVAAFVEKALSKDPGQRYQDAGQMREALEDCRDVLNGALDEEAYLATLREGTAAEADPLGQLLAGADPAITDADTLSTGLPVTPGTPVPARRGTTTRISRVGTGSPRSGSGAGSGPGARRGSGSGPVVSTTPPAAAPSRTPIYLAAGAGLVLLGAGIVVAALYLNRPQPQASKTNEGATASALVSVAVEARLDVARRSLELKDLKGAFDEAEKALKLDPSNADARALQAQAKAALDEVESAVSDARAAAKAGDTERATKALSRVLALMPDHPVATELSSQLNSRFKAQADDASAGAKRSAEAAQKANAGSLREFADAAHYFRQAEGLYGQKQYTQATQRFLEAKRAYESAAASAHQMAARPTPSAAPPVTVAAAPQLPVAPPTPAPTALPSLPPVAQASAAPAPAPVAPAPALEASDEAGVRRVIADFAHAIETKDIALYKAARPGLSSDDERKLRAAFEAVKTQQVQIAIEAVAIAGTQATVQVTRTGSVNGRPVPPLKQVLRLSKGPSGWTIREISQ